MMKFIIAMICALVAVLPAVAQDMNSKGDNIVGEYLLSSTSKQATRMSNPLKVKNHIFNNDSFVATVDASRWWSIFSSLLLRSAIMPPRGDGDSSDCCIFAPKPHF